MSKSISYHRLFIMMQEEDRGHGKGGKPTGYLKLEQRELKGKVFVHVQNVDLPRGSQVLKAYLLSSTNPENDPLYIGVINLRGNSGDVVLDLNSSNNSKSSNSVIEYDTVVVMCKDIANDCMALTFPLVGYKNQSWDWRNVLSSIESNNKAALEQQDNDQPVSEMFSEMRTEEKQEPEKIEIIEETQTTEVNQESIIEEQDYNKNPVGFIWEHNSKTIEGQELNDDTIEEQEQKNHVVEESIKVEQLKKESNNIFSKLSSFKIIQQPFDKVNLNCQWWYIDDMKFDLNKIYEGIEGIATVNDFNLLNNILVFNNPYALNAIYRYGYYLLGVRSKEQGNAESVFYAIPSRYGVEPHPLLGAQAYATWMPKNGYKSLLGSMGYWIVKVDINSAELSAFN